MFENLLFAFLVALTAVVLLRAAMRWKSSSPVAAPAGASPAEKAEALFVAMFPELQPHFHPEKLVAYVAARRGRTPARDGFTWKQAPGFDGASVDIRFVKEREECAVVDDAGGILGRFRFEGHPDGGVLRVGAGKLTVDLRNERDPAVRYWHPEREFKWTRRGGWRFKTPVAERPIDSGDRGTSWSESSSSSSSSSDGVRTAAAAAGIAGLGGTFDGGGASAGWGGAATTDDARGSIDPAGLATAAVLASGDSRGGSDGEPVAVSGVDAGGDGTGDSGIEAGSDSSHDSGSDSGSDSSGDSSSDSGSTSY